MPGQQDPPSSSSSSTQGEYVDLYLRRRRDRGQSSGKYARGSTAEIPVTLKDDDGKRRNGDGAREGDREVLAAATAAAGAADNRRATAVNSSGVVVLPSSEEAVSARVDTVEDKIVNLTKLVKYTQSLQEQRITGLEQELHSTKSRLRRQEQVNANVLQELEDMKARTEERIAKAVEAAVSQYAESQKPLRDALERQIAELRVLETELAPRESCESGGSDPRSGSWATSLLQRMEGLAVKLSAQTEATETLKEAFHSALEEAVLGVGQRAEAEWQTHGSRVDGVEKAVSELTGNLNGQVTAISALEKALEEVQASIARVDCAQTRRHRGVTTDVAEVKEWAARNMQRLKKHVDVVYDEVAALQCTSHAQSSRVPIEETCAAQAQQRNVLDLLQRKTEEVDFLNSVLDREIVRMHAVTDQNGSTENFASSTQLKRPPGIFDDLNFPSSR